MAKARIHIFHHSETVSSSHTRKVILPPVLFAMSTKGCALVTEVAPLGSTPNRFDGIHLDTGVEIVSRIIVAWVLRKVELVHLSICGSMQSPFFKNHPIIFWKVFTIQVFILPLSK